MKRVVARDRGGPEVLSVLEDSLPEPGPDEVRVRVLAAGVAFGDLLWMSGVVPGSPKPPFTPGYDFVGVVDKLGSRVGSPAVGQHVAALVHTGGFAEYSCWKPDELTPVPADVDPVRLTCLTLNYVTAYALINRIGKLRTGKRVLMHGASGGIGTAMLELCRMFSIKAFGTASKDKHELVARLGGDPIDYRTEDFVKVVDREGGVDMVVDHLGGNHLARSFRCLRPDGILVSTSTYSAVLGQTGPVETLAGILRLQLWNMWPNRRRALLFNVTSFYQKHPGLYSEDLSRLIDQLAAGKLDPVLDSVYPLEEAPSALEHVRDGKAQGKVVLVTNAYQG